jgi:ribonucleoside-diphosphate reductase alpha chain
VSAKDLFKKFMKSTVESGMPYVFYRDTVNRVNPNKHA